MKKVLIVDDSSTARMFVRRCLEIAGLGEAEFTEAKNGLEAISALEKSGFDLVVTDLNMPDMDGTELVRRVKLDTQWQLVPIFVITSLNNKAKEQELIALGATGVISKPVSPASIKMVLEGVKR